MKKPTEKHKLLLVALPESSASVLYGLYDVLSSVGKTWHALTGEDTGISPFDVSIIAKSKRSFLCAGGIPVRPDMKFAEVHNADIVIIPDLNIPVDQDSRGRWPEATRWLRHVFSDDAVLCSVCTGSVVLADTGLLDQKVATTHWGMIDHFQRYYPCVNLAADRVLVPDGPDHRIITGGGAGAWEDLALYLISRFRTEAEAVRTSKIWVMGDRSEGQLPFAAAAKPRHHSDSVIADCQTWIAEYYRQPSPVTKMIKQSGLTERTFKRRFRKATGYTPLEYIQSLRVEEARHLLETCDLPSEEIGRMVGYEDPAFFRRLFKRRTAVTPARYRQRFRSMARRMDAGSRQMRTS